MLKVDNMTPQYLFNKLINLIIILLIIFLFFNTDKFWARWIFKFSNDNESGNLQVHWDL